MSSSLNSWFVGDIRDWVSIIAKNDFYDIGGAEGPLFTYEDDPAAAKALANSTIVIDEWERADMLANDYSCCWNNYEYKVKDAVSLNLMRDKADLRPLPFIVMKDSLIHFECANAYEVLSSLVIDGGHMLVIDQRSVLDELLKYLGTRASIVHESSVVCGECGDQREDCACDYYNAYTVSILRFDHE